MYALAICAFVMGFAVIRTQTMVQVAENKRTELLSLGQKIQKKIKSQEHNRIVVEHFCGKDPLYLHNKLESFLPLSQELAMVQSKVQQQTLPEDVMFERRLHFLNSNDNKFTFVESTTELGNHYKEVVERQSHPVEISSDDLAYILNIIEGPQDDVRPHLILSEGRIERKGGTVQEVWSATFNIVRREYFP
jgi:hypothetical protein